MANYYLIENKTTNNIDTVFNWINPSSNSNIIYAEGEDIDFTSYFSYKSSATMVKLIVHDTIFEVNDLDLDFCPSSKVHFKNCTLNNLTINLESLCEVAFINKCNVTGTLNIISASPKTSSSAIIIDDSTINSLVIETSKLTSLEIKSHSKINDITISRNLEYEGQIDNLSIHNQVEINNCYFSNFEISKLYIDKATLKNAKFKSIIIIDILTLNFVIESKFNFINCTFVNLSTIDIRHSNILDIEFYNLTLISDSFIIRYLNSKLCSLVINHSFINCKIEFVSILDIDLPHISTNDSVFKELVIFERNNSENIEFHNTIFQNGVLIPLNLKQSNKVRDVIKIQSSVWCILKNQSLLGNDKITALNYRKYEMLAYTNELKNIKGQYSEKLVLWLNRLSNNHGLSWTRGIVFTIISWLVFFTLYEWSANRLFISFNSFLSEAISFLWLTQGLEVLTDNLKEGSFFLKSVAMILTFILGKIAIAYGIYQTISAFRKHGKI